jgi:hypothetical protein
MDVRPGGQCQPDREAVFCRVTQMELLRLLTDEFVMGKDVVWSRDAWRIY